MIFSSLSLSTPLWGPPSLVFSGYRVQSGRGVKLTTLFHQVPRLEWMDPVLLPYAVSARAVITLAVVSGHCLGGNGTNREKNLILYVTFSACADWVWRKTCSRVIYPSPCVLYQLLVITFFFYFICLPFQCLSPGFFTIFVPVPLPSFLSFTLKPLKINRYTGCFTTLGHN